MCKKLCFFILIVALLALVKPASAVVVDGYQEWTVRTQLADIGGLEITSTGHAKFTARVDQDAVDVTIAAGGILESQDTYKLPDDHPEPTTTNVYVNGTWNANNIESKGTTRAAYIYVGATGVINIEIGYGGTAPYENPADYDPLTWLADNSLLVDPSLDPAAWFIQITDMGGGAAQITVEALAPQVGFDSPASGDLESVSPATFSVCLSGPQEETVTVDYCVAGGTATRDVDYTITCGTLAFNPGETCKTISIEIADDGVDEDDETIVVTLSNPTGPDVELGTNVQHTYTIIDPRPGVQFESAASTGAEEDSPAQIAVSLSHTADETVTVNYSVTGGTATGSGVDYTLSPGTLTFSPGQTTKYINIAIVDDGIDEGTETVVLTLSAPTNAKLGSNKTHTFTINDFNYAPFPDSDTVGLWLFDESDYPHTTLTDASEYAMADLCLMDGGSMVDGRFARALRVGSGHAVCYAGFAGKVPEEELREDDGDPSGLWGPTEGPGALLNGLAGNTWTIELWLNLSSAGSNVSIIDLGQAYNPGLELILNAGSFQLVNHYAGVQATCPTGQLTGGWHHVAFTRSASTVRHFLDGQLQAGCSVSSVSKQSIPNLQKPSDREHEGRGFDGMGFEQRRQNRFNFAVGTDRHGSRSMNGMADEMRISRVVRYSGNFSPQSFSRNYGAGALLPSVADGPSLLFNPGPVSTPLSFGDRKHVFIDDAILASKSGVQITMNRPYGKQEIAGFSVGDSKWRPSVFDVDGVVYMAIPESYGSTHGTTRLATSPDGLNFTMQGAVITETPLYGAFFKDLNPNVAPEELYKVNAFVANRGMYMYLSPDGRDWRRNETIQLPLRSGGEGECFWDDQRGRYASYIKRDSSFDDPECDDQPGRVAVGFWTNEVLKAWPFNHMNSPYFEGYPFPSVTCEGPVSFGVTSATQVYRTRAIKYPWAADVYLAFIWRYPGDDGPRHVDLGISRNGENWSFFGTNWYIPLGSAEEELSLYGLIRRGDEIWQYVDEGGAHGGSASRKYYRYRQRLDGFVSLDAGGSGTAATHPLVFAGDTLELNIKATGTSKVAITNQAGQEISGFGLGDCDPISTDSVSYVVTWNGDSDVRPLAGTMVRLKFQMQNTKLYAFEFVSLGPAPCECLGDVSDTAGFGDPDGKVDIGDLNALLFAMLAAYPEGDDTGLYDIDPAGLECADVSDTSGFGAPDGKVDIGDLNALLFAMLGAYPDGDSSGIYEIPCLE